MVLLTFVDFCLKNYLRGHRYLLDLVALVITSIFLGGFLTSKELNDEGVWLLLSVFAVIVTLFTSTSIFFLEKRNTLYFLLSKPNGRQYLLLSKIIATVLIDLGWVLLFALIYGACFFSWHYFLLLPLRLLLVSLLLLLSSLLLSFVYTYHPLSISIIFIMLTFGCIINKLPLLAIQSPAETLQLLILFFPPLFEIIMLTISLNYNVLNFIFIGISLLQIIALFYISNQKIQRKNFI